MIFHVVQEGASRTIDLKILGGARTVTIDGCEMECDWLALPDGRYSFRMGSRVYDLAVEPDPEGWTVTGREGRQRMAVKDPRKLGSSVSSQEAAAGLQRVCAEMPGKVIRVIVQKGDHVRLEQPLLVLEAMKMQNEIRAPKNGIIQDVAVAEGKTVTSGEFLLSLE
jgi:biotin carboxyl carrier protein